MPPRRSYDMPVEQAQILVAIHESLVHDRTTHAGSLRTFRDLYSRTTSQALRELYLAEINKYTYMMNPVVVPQGPSMTEIIQAKGVEIPNEYLCPITMELMKNPVILEDGQVYEKTAIQRWFVGNNTSPLTKKLVNKSIIIPCHAMRNMIEDFIKKHTEDKPVAAQVATQRPTQLDQGTQTDIVPEQKKTKKREPTAYNKFVQERMRVYKEQNASESITEIMKKIAQEWQDQKATVSS